MFKVRNFLSGLATIFQLVQDSFPFCLTYCQLKIIQITTTKITHTIIHLLGTSKNSLTFILLNDVNGLFSPLVKNYCRAFVIEGSYGKE